MTFLKPLALAMSLSVFAMPALAETITVSDAYARVSRPNAPTAAAFMMIMNTSDADDRLIAAQFEGADKTELHTHIMEADTGIARMRPVEFIAVPAGGAAELKRGADHVMLIGLNEDLAEGDTISLTLIFETAGEITLDVPVNPEGSDRAAGHGEAHGR